MAIDKSETHWAILKRGGECPLRYYFCSSRKKRLARESCSRSSSSSSNSLWGWWGGMLYFFPSFFTWTCLRVIRFIRSCLSGWDSFSTWVRCLLKLMTRLSHRGHWDLCNNRYKIKHKNKIMGIVLFCLDYKRYFVWHNQFLAQTDKAAFSSVQFVPFFLVPLGQTADPWPLPDPSCVLVSDGGPCVWCFSHICGRLI